MRHALGVLGVLAAGVLLAVSCAMNWRFGFSLGRTELDGQIYGAASAAADCMKALVPFFFFAAIRNRMWSQALASALVWVVVTSYSLTSALGHAALNRLDTAGQRTASADSYKDHRADLARAQEQLSWIPQHRPAQAVQADIDALQMRLDTRKSRLLLVFNLVAFVSTLMLVWIVYTQIVVIQHHWSRVRRPVVRSVNNGNQVSSTVTPQT